MRSTSVLHKEGSLAPVRPKMIEGNFSGIVQSVKTGSFGKCCKVVKYLTMFRCNDYEL